MKMEQCYIIETDGINGYDQWFCNVADENDGLCITEEQMFADVRQVLTELGGGHADIINADTDEVFAEIEI